MSWNRPTLRQLHDRIRTDLQSGTDGSPFLRRSFEAALSWALAKLADGQHGHLAWIALQIHPKTCGEAMLLLWGQVFGVTRKEAAKASGPATFTGVDGTVIPALTVFQIGTVEYESLADATVASGSATPTVRARVAGAASNVDAGAAIKLAGPITGIDSQGTVAAPGISGGTDEEELEDYRARLMLRIQTPPRGGADGDYETWALEVAGVTRAWEFAQVDGVGTISLTFMRDDDGPLATDAIPDAGEVATVQAYVDSKAPLDIRPYSPTQRVHVFASTANAIDMTIALSPNTAAVQAAVLAEVKALFLREAAPNEATPVVSHIDEAISTAAGEQDHDITAIGSLTPPAGGINVLGTITWAAL